jgi:hypothetical protein
MVEVIAGMKAGCLTQMHLQTGASGLDAPDRSNQYHVTPLKIRI